MKKNNKIVADTTVVRMSYDTYIQLKHLIEKDIQKLEDEYHTACRFIPNEPYVHGKPSGIDKAHKVWSEVYAKMKRMLEELHVAAGATYKDHPNKEIREFWGLKD